jgi:O-antigen ligase
MVLGLALTLFVFAFPVVLADLGPGPFFWYRLLVFPADLTLAATVLAVAWIALRTRARPGVGTMLLGALTLILGIAWAIHPSPQGVQIVLRFVGATAFAYGFQLLRRDERILQVGVLGIVTAIQLGIAVAQMVNQGPLGLPSFGEVADPLLNYLGTYVPRGTMHAQYVLAGLALLTVFLMVREGLAAARSIVFVGAGALATIVGLTLSRAAAASLVLGCGVLLVGARTRRRELVEASGAVALGALVAAVICLPGWTVRAGTGLGLTGREALIDESWSLIAEAPLTGVGPGRSTLVMQERFPDLPWYDYLPPHGLPLIATVEGGIGAGAIAIALLIAPAWRARRDVRALAVYASFIGLLLTDQFPYNFLQGVIMLGLWVGALDGLARDTSEAIPIDEALTRFLWRRLDRVRLVAPGRSGA